MSDDSDVTGPSANQADRTDFGGPEGEAQLADAEAAMADVKARLAEIPAEVVVTNHVMGLYELAAIHLSSTPPDFHAASLAIDAVGFLVDGLGERLGDEHATMRDALANLRMAYVTLRSQQS